VKTCTFPDCERRLIARGLCHGHYKQMQQGKELHTLRVVRTCEATWVCIGCKREKCTSEFAKGRNQCNVCVSKYKTQWVAGNRERTRAYVSEWRVRNPEYCRSRDHARYWADPERARKRNADWKRANPGKCRLNESRRRARKASVSHEPYSRAEIFSRWSGRCCYCDAPAEHLDHVTPISRQGADAEWNLVPACATCNCSKGAKTLAEWAATF
jgi:hypothetical protein